ncbi:MAG: isoprenylcysteine carboxylmethyltransferase family protein [Microthrixaceae bacterium]
MTVLALLLYVAFAAVAFGWRTWVQWRQTGDTGLRLHAEAGTTQWWAKLGFVAALVAGFAAPIAGLTGLDPIPPLDNATVRMVGLILAAVGIAATTAAQVRMGASWRIGVDPAERTGLVTGGVFALVRNPIFTAMLVTALGLTLMVGNIISLAGLGALFAALEVQVRFVEEPYLRTVHGPDYERYTATAGRFLPGLGRGQIS